VATLIRHALLELLQLLELLFTDFSRASYAAKTHAVGEGDASSCSREPLVDQVVRSRVRRLVKIVALKSVRAKAAPLQALGLFYIGNLFSNLFQFGFRVHNQLRDFGVVGFGAQGIEFAADFLAEKFQRSSDGVFGFGDT
jgi:hypothetical protein